MAEEQNLQRVTDKLVEQNQESLEQQKQMTQTLDEKLSGVGQKMNSGFSKLTQTTSVLAGTLTESPLVMMATEKIMGLLQASFSFVIGKMKNALINRLEKQNKTNELQYEKLDELNRNFENFTDAERERAIEQRRASKQKKESKVGKKESSDSDAGMLGAVFGGSLLARMAGAPLALLAMMSTGFLAPYNKLIKGIKTFFGKLKPIFLGLLQSVKRMVLKIPGVRKVVGTIGRVISTIKNTFINLWLKSRLLGKIVNRVEKIVKPIISALTRARGYLGGLRGIFSSMTATLGNFFPIVSKLGRAIGKIFWPILVAYEIITSFINNETLKGKIIGAISGITNAFAEIPRMAYNWIVKPLLNMIPGIDLPKMPNLEPYIKSAFGWFWDLFTKPNETLKPIFSWVDKVNPIDSIKNLFSTIKSYIPSVKEIRNFNQKYNPINKIAQMFRTIADMLPSFKTIKEKIKDMIPGWAYGWIPGIGGDEEKSKQEVKEKRSKESEIGSSLRELSNVSNVRDNPYIWDKQMSAEDLKSKSKTILKNIMGIEYEEKRESRLTQFKNTMEDLRGADIAENKKTAISEKNIENRMKEIKQQRTEEQKQGTKDVKQGTQGGNGNLGINAPSTNNTSIQSQSTMEVKVGADPSDKSLGLDFMRNKGMILP